MSQFIILMEFVASYRVTMDLYDNVSAKRRGILKTQGPPLLMLLTLIHGFLVPPLFECGMRVLIILVKASLKPRFLKCVTVICIDSQKPQAKSLIHRSKAKMYFR